MLTALSYHQKVKDHFKQQTKTWDYFAQAKRKEEQLVHKTIEELKYFY